MARATQQLTLEEFLKLPEEKPALEFHEGMVTQKVSPKFRHARLQSKLATRINDWAEPRRQALALTELRATFAGSSLVPDVAVYRWERLPRDARGRFVDDVWEPADIAIEVRSPDQSRRELTEKCRWFVTNGVRIAVLVDPDREAATVFQPGEEPRALGSDEAIDLSSVLPGLQIPVAEIFGWLD